MAQAKKKTATRTAKKATAKRCCASKKSQIRYEKYQKGQKSNVFFVVCMTFLAATLLFADLLMMTA
ncbi:hypothetical protein IJU85_02215 [Candidatus Saccharibacteria bacterium]|nr:hypothetical protein [Candidatus Saccharibacteria bacterium]